MWRVNHFDVRADDPERAMKFYKEVFGWKVEKWHGPFDYWLVMTGNPDEPGIDGGIAKREDPNARILRRISSAKIPPSDFCHEREHSIRLRN